MWDGTRWSSLGTGVDGTVWALAAFDNSLFVGGDFGKAGGKPSAHIARWHGAPTAVNESIPMRSGFILAENYPNPFNPSTSISYTIPKHSSVRLRVLNVLGQLVETLVDQDRQPGTYNVTFEASNLPSGVYFYRMQAGEFIQTKKMLLMR
jgi:hypothetical protein